MHCPMPTPQLYIIFVISYFKYIYIYLSLDSQLLFRNCQYAQDKLELKADPVEPKSLPARSDAPPVLSQV